jgi:hypothetical protein
LAAWLKKRGVRQAQAVAKKLRVLAAETVQVGDALTESMREGLRAKIALLRAIRGVVTAEENEMARSLVQSPCALLTSIPGVGVTYAAGITAEYGAPAGWRGVASMFAYAGCAQMQKQTGGSAKPPVQQGLPRSCNHLLKNYLLQAAFHAGTTPHQAARRVPGLEAAHRLQRHWQSLEARGGCTRLGTARLFLHIITDMVREERIYLPDWWLHHEKYPPTGPVQAAAWLEAATAAMEEKWQGCNLDGIPAADNHLNRWRKKADELMASLMPVPF